MALQIENLSHEQIDGILDGALPFAVSFQNDQIVARIADWHFTRPGKTPRSIGEMRNTSYALLAKYRNEQKILQTG